MTVLFLSPSAGLGGAERVLLTMTAALRTSHPELPLHVVLLDDGPLTALLHAQGVPTSCVHLPAAVAQLGDSQFALGVARRKLELCCQGIVALPGLCGFLRRLRARVRHLRPALIHSNGIKTHLLARLARLNAAPVLWHVHDFYSTRPLARRLLAWAARRTDTALAVSEAVASDFRTVAPTSRVVVVPNAIDTERFRPHSVSADRLDGLAGLPPAPPRTLRVGLVATYARWKGHDVFLQAAAQVLRSLPLRAEEGSVRFYVIGGPVYQTHGSQFDLAELRGLAGALGIGDRVGFIGFQPDPSKLYVALDVVVHASTRPEPFGLTIIEAMACGRAVIATAAGGAAELVTPGHDALTVAPGDAAALVGALQQLLAAADMRARLGAHARATAIRRFDAARLGPQLTAVYRRLLTTVPTACNLPRSFKLASLAAQVPG